MLRGLDPGAFALGLSIHRGGLVFEMFFPRVVSDVHVIFIGLFHEFASAMLGTCLVSMGQKIYYWWIHDIDISVSVYAFDIGRWLFGLEIIAPVHGFAI